MSDEDVEFLSELPYTLRIPQEWCSNDDNPDTTGDVVVVHAGLIPGVALSEQTTTTMVTLREVVVESSSSRSSDTSTISNNNNNNNSRVPWASVWSGPDTIVFGHDARRGLQQYPWAVGLDTGACYGKQLTGLVLPERTIVQVEALDVHCPIGDKV